MQELEDGLKKKKKLKKKKTHGAVDITNAFLEHLEPIGKKILFSILNKSWHMGLIPSAWRDACV